MCPVAEIFGLASHLADTHQRLTQELADARQEITLLTAALAMGESTPGSRQECADLRNVIQAACIGGLPAMATAWAKYFPDHPITIQPKAYAPGVGVGDGEVF
jgi:hypothetical protein